MQDLEKRVEEKKVGNDVKKEASSSGSYYKPRISLGAEPYAISSIISGVFVSIFLEGLYTKVFGGTFIAAGVTTLWAGGYSPTKMVKGFLEDVGRLACCSYDYIKKRCGIKKEK